MPKLEPKVVQRELEQGLLWPVYWLYGHERMKSRELLKRIRKAALGEQPQAFCPETTLEGSELDASAIVEAAQSPSLGGGLNFIVVRDAHAIKESEALAGLLGPKAKASELGSVCVFLSKDLDGRKKLSKLLAEKAAVVPCEEVPEAEREAWVGYLAKRRGLDAGQEISSRLCILDPWSLDIVDQELEKLALAREGGSSGPSYEDALLGAGALSFGSLGGADAFLECFFMRDLRATLERVEAFADQPDESLPLLGLMAWNVRQLALLASDRENGTRHAKLNPYLAERFQRWVQRWRLGEVIELQAELEGIDFGFKQKPLEPLGLWGSLAMRFCR